LTLSQSLPLTGAVVVCTPQEVALLDATRAITMFRQLKVPVLGMIENMSFLDVAAYVRDHGTADAVRMVDEGRLFTRETSRRMPLFGSGGARRKAEQLGVPFLGELPLNLSLRERGDAGRTIDVLQEGSPSRPYLQAIVEQLAAQISIQNLRTPQMPKLEILN
jgi:ATP-binding protein involved in chromosome partitioning